MKKETKLRPWMIGVAFLTIVAGATYAAIPATRLDGGVQMVSNGASTISSGKKGIWVDTNNQLHFDNGTGSQIMGSGAVDIAAYGGHCDGTTSDSTAFAAAVTATPVNGTMVISCNTKISSSVSITKPMTVLVEAGVTLTVTSTTISIAADNVTLVGRGWSSKIVQGTAGFYVITSSAGNNGISLRDLQLVGVAGTGFSSGNSALKVTAGGDGLKVSDCKFLNFQHYAIWNHAMTGVNVSDSTFIGNVAYLQEGGRNTILHHNIIRDPQTPNTTFVVPVQFDSATTGGANYDITIDDNEFYNWTAAQNILLHDGRTFSIHHNIIENGYYGIALGTFTAGDLIQDGDISGNVIISSTTSGLATSIANIGIVASGSAAAPVARLKFTGNYVYGSNQYTDNDSWGCMLLSGNTVSDILIVGNEFDSCRGNGISMTATNDNRITIIGNAFHAFTATAGTVKVGVGIWSATSQSGYIASNFIDGMSQAIRIDINTAGGIHVGPNDYTNNTATVFNPANGQSTTTTAAGGFQLPAGQGVDTNAAGVFPLCSGNCTSSTWGNSAVTSLTLTTSSTNGTIQLNGALQCRANAIAQSTASMTLNAAIGCNPVVTLTSSVTSVTLNNFPLGQRYCVTFVQDATGSRTVTGWPANVKWLPTAYRGTTHTAPTLTTTAAARDTICWIHDGTNLVEVSENLNN